MMLFCNLFIERILYTQTGKFLFVSYDISLLHVCQVWNPKC